MRPPHASPETEIPAFFLEISFGIHSNLHYYDERNQRLRAERGKEEKEFFGFVNPGLKPRGYFHLSHPGQRHPSQHGIQRVNRPTFLSID